MANPLLRGLLLGFVIAATPGPIFFLCLSRTFRGGWRHGLASGLGIATADAAHSLAASFGLAILIAAIEPQRRWISLAAGIFLLVLAVRALREDAAAPRADLDVVGSLGPAFASMFLLTAGNPLTIVSFAALLTGSGVQSVPGPAIAAIVAGVFFGSATWWLVLVMAAARVRSLVSSPVTRGLNTVSAIALAAFGLNAILVAAGVRW